MYFSYFSLFLHHSLFHSLCLFHIFFFFLLLPLFTFSVFHSFVPFLIVSILFLFLSVSRPVLSQSPSVCVSRSHEAAAATLRKILRPYHFRSQMVPVEKLFFLCVFRSGGENQLNSRFNRNLMLFVPKVCFIIRYICSYFTTIRKNYVHRHNYRK